MNNTRFATAIHILALLASAPEEWLSSEWIAGSINVNPVVVRREIGVLRAAGLVESRRGKEGGTRLRKAPGAVCIADIYRAVQHTELLGKKNRQPNPACPVGKNINQSLELLFREADQVMASFLGKKTLAAFVKEMK